MMSQCIQLIQPIYEFSSSEASGDQTEKSARATLSRLVKFIKTDSNIPQSFSPSPQLSDAFKELVELLELSDCKFLPEYGCCLISKGFSRFKTHSCNIILVSLDQWKRMVHSSTQNNLRSQSSIPLNQDVTSIGVLQSCDMPLFRETFRKILTKVAQNATNQSSPGNKHHKTPGQIIAVANCALSLDANKTPEAPEGGYTDVGLHTGGKLRSTAWPLVQALVSFLMKHVMQLRRFPPEETAALFVLFDLWNARDVIGTMAAAESITATYVDNMPLCFVPVQGVELLTNAVVWTGKLSYAHVRRNGRLLSCWSMLQQSARFNSSPFLTRTRLLTTTSAANHV